MYRVQPELEDRIWPRGRTEGFHHPNTRLSSTDRDFLIKLNVVVKCTTLGKMGKISHTEGMSKQFWVNFTLEHLVVSKIIESRRHATFKSVPNRSLETGSRRVVWLRSVVDLDVRVDFQTDFLLYRQGFTWYTNNRLKPGNGVPGQVTRKTPEWSIEGCTVPSVTFLSFGFCLWCQQKDWIITTQLICSHTYGPPSIVNPGRIFDGGVIILGRQ